MRTVWVGARALLTALLVATVGVLALFVGVAGVVPASAATATYTYDTAAYAYDGPARLASPATVASCALGSPSGLEVASWGRSASARGCCTAANTVDNVLPTPQVSSARLQNLVDNLYKGTTNPNRVGTGTTMDAIRSEMATGVPTAGRMHTVKGQETLQGLNNWLRRNPDAPYQDRLVAQSLADELARVLGGGS